MRAIDTNVLVYAVMRASRFHAPALQVLREHAEGDAPWAIAWPCVYELLRIVTHPRIYSPPAPLERAQADLAGILASPSLVMLSETEHHGAALDAVLAESGASGNLVHDAHIAALCREHGVREIVTGDRDFLRFPELRVINPFADAPR